MALKPELKKEIESEALRLYPVRLMNEMNDGYQETWDNNRQNRALWVQGATAMAEKYEAKLNEAIELIKRASKYPMGLNTQKDIHDFLQKLK